VLNKILEKTNKKVHRALKKADLKTVLPKYSFLH
jgi:hypothetical protein